jgi:hypothetical protein
LGVQYRRSKSFGPVRVNLSKSGLGTSVGVRGLRVGASARGQLYARGGRDGVYFRKTLSTSSRPKSAKQPRVVQMESATGTPAGELAKTLKSSESDRYTKRLNGVRRRRVTWAAFFVCWLVLEIALGGYYYWGLAAVSLVFSLTDRVRLKYKLPPEAQASFNSFVESFRQAAASDRVWMIDRHSQVSNSYQRKAGSSTDTVIHTEHALAITKPRDFIVNQRVPTLKASGRSLYFLPDRIIVRDGRRFAELPYHDVLVSSLTARSTEHGPVPRDAQKVGTTWTHVNKDGGPDHRYKNNSVVPILLYDEIVLANRDGGFESEWQFSRTGSIGNWVSNLYKRGAVHPT